MAFKLYNHFSCIVRLYDSRMMRSFEKKLPVEQWQQVMAKVSPGDLCNVMLASRHMNSMASWPELWAGMKVNMGKVRENGLAQFYSIDRFKKIKQMRFKGMKLTSVELERLLNEIPGSPLENINFATTKFSGVSPYLLASAVKVLTSVNLYNAILTTGQCIKLLEASLSSTTLVHLDLRWVNLSGVPPNLLASAVKRFDTFNLCHTCLTTDQYIKLLDASLSSTTLVDVDLSLTSVNLSNAILSTDQCIKLLEASLSSTTLVDLDLRWVNLSGVPPDLLACAVKRLNTIKLSNTSLTTDQCIKLLEASLSSTTLVDLDLIWVNLSGVPPDLLASAVKRLNTIKLSNTHLTTDQCITLLEASLFTTTLVDLELRDVNLSGVPPDLLVSAVKRLNTMKLPNTCLTTDQSIKLLEASLSTTAMVDLDLRCVNLSGVPPDLLASAVKHFNSMNLSKTSLTTDQYIKLLEGSLSSTTLIDLDLTQKLSAYDLSEVPPDLLASAVKRLNTRKLSTPHLKNGQCIKLLEASLSSTTLVDLDLTHVDLSGVPPDLLASAVKRLNTIKLLRTRLTTDQCIKLLEASLSSTTLVDLDLRWVNLSGVPPDLLASAVKRLKKLST